jgi:hypothetical protein
MPAFEIRASATDSRVELAVERARERIAQVAHALPAIGRLLH